MKIALLTQRDPFFVDTFLRSFDKSGIQYELVCFPNFNGGVVAGFKKALALYGYLGVIKLIYLRLTKFRKPNLVNCRKITYIKNIELKDSLLKEFSKYDVVCSVSAPCKINTSLFDEKTQLINIHCGALPKYAGMMPIFWQLYNSEKSIIVSLHEMAAEIDTGKLYTTRELQVTGSLFHMSVEAKKLSAEMLVRFLSQVDMYRVGEPQSEEITALNKFPSEDEVRQLSKRKRLI